MLEHSGLPKCFWAEASTTTVHILNRAQTLDLPGSTPFEALTGSSNPHRTSFLGTTLYPSPTGSGIPQMGSSPFPVIVISIPAAQETLEEMDKQLQEIRANLKRASDRQKSYADQHCSPREFKVGEKVFLRVKPKSSSLKLGKIQEACL